MVALPKLNTHFMEENNVKLKTKYFIDEYELKRFVNENNMRKENIQEICSLDGYHYMLFYWE